MRQSGYVIEIESIRSVVWTGDVGIGPVRRLLQVIIRIGMRQARRQSSRCLQGEIELDGAPFEVVTPLRLGIKAERNHRQQISARRCICQIEDVLGGEQALIRVSGVNSSIGVIAQGEICSYAPGQIWADQSIRLHLARCIQRCWIDEYRSMANIPVLGGASVVSIVRLRKTTDVMIADG